MKAIKQQIKELLVEEGAVDQDELIDTVDGDPDDVIAVLHTLMKNGKIAYDIEWDIDGRGKEYAVGLIEED